MLLLATVFFRQVCTSRSGYIRTGSVLHLMRYQVTKTAMDAYKNV